MSIFHEMHATRSFDSEWEFLEVRRMLSEAISRRHVLQIPVSVSSKLSSSEEWYQDQETREIYSLLPPEEKIRGHWEKVNMTNPPRTEKPIQ